MRTKTLQDTINIICDIPVTCCFCFEKLEDEAEQDLGFCKTCKSTIGNCENDSNNQPTD